VTGSRTVGKMPSKTRRDLPIAPDRRHRRHASLAALALVLTALAASPVAATGEAEARARRNGWGYLLDRLASDGVPKARAAGLFADPRVPKFDGLFFNLAPRESQARYRQLRSAASFRDARLCRARYAKAFDAAEAREGVPASLVAAIVHVESSCGRSTGRSTVAHRLARLAMANEPRNVAEVVREHAGTPPDPLIAEQVHLRAAYLERTFYPEVRAVFTIAERLKIDPLGMEGSGAGAFGFPQFLPTSYLRFGVDGNGDGRVSLFDMDDAAASCARFLAANGWKGDLTLAQRRQVLWQYNRSDAYIDTILAIQREIAAGGDGRVADAARAD
jgi:membrane-bound lytic murein transglycosylase B